MYNKVKQTFNKCNPLSKLAIWTKNSKNINNNNKKLNTWQMSFKKKSNTWQTNKCQINATCSAKWSADIWGTTRGLGRAGAIKVRNIVQLCTTSRSNFCVWKCFTFSSSTEIVIHYNFLSFVALKVAL